MPHSESRHTARRSEDAPCSALLKERIMDQLGLNIEDDDESILKGEVTFVQTSTWLCGHSLSVVRPRLSSICETLSALGLTHVFRVADVSAGTRQD